MTQGHEPRWGIAGGRGTEHRGINERKTWDNYNSTINKIYFLKSQIKNLAVILLN